MTRNLLSVFQPGAGERPSTEVLERISADLAGIHVDLPAPRSAGPVPDPGRDPGRAHRRAHRLGGRSWRSTTSSSRSRQRRWRRSTGPPPSPRSKGPPPRSRWSTFGRWNACTATTRSVPTCCAASAGLPTRPRPTRPRPSARATRPRWRSCRPGRPTCAGRSGRLRRGQHEVLAGVDGDPGRDEPGLGQQPKSTGGPTAGAEAVGHGLRQRRRRA
jgi:hypothetical protein